MKLLWNKDRTNANYKSHKGSINKILAILFVVLFCISFFYSFFGINETKAAESWGFYTDNLNPSSPIKLSGSSFYSGGDIYLARNAEWQTGAAFSLNKIEESTGFSTFFCLSTNSPSNPPADGFCIIISRDTNVIDYSTLGGQNLGYGNIGASIGIEIDMYHNSEPDIPHMYLWARQGSQAAESGSHGEGGTTHLDRNLVMNGDFYVWVEYNNTAHVISVYIAKSDVKPANPVATYNLNLGSIVGNSYYVGISASTGTYYQNHIIKEWGWSNIDKFNKECKLTVQPNGGTWEGSKDNQVFDIVIGKTKDIPLPTRYGYDFDGWTLQGLGSKMTSLNQDATFTMGNEDAVLTANWTPWKGDIVLTKTDSITHELLDEAIFGVYEWNGSSYDRIGQLEDNHDGTYTMRDLIYKESNLGKYRVIEEQAPLYYTNPNAVIDIVISKPGHNEYPCSVEDEPNKVKVTAVKIDEETKNRIKGVTFTVYEWDVATQRYIEYKRNGKTMTLTFQESDRTYISDWLYSNRTNQGKFRIVETGTPDGYFGNWSNLANKEKVNNDIIIDLSNNGQTLTLKNNDAGEYTNKRVKGTINVDKIDSETRRYLAQGDASLDGAVYGLYAAEEIIHKDTVTGKIYSKDELVDSQTTVNGKITFNDVEIGNYYIKEIKAPEGYIIDDKKYPITMNYEGEEVEHLVRSATLVEDVKKQAFTVQKLSENDPSTDLPVLEKAGFKIYLIKDLAGVKNGSIVPNEKGKYNAEDFLEYDFSNEETALDYSQNQNGERIPELFSDNLGRITSPELAYGQYVIVETTVPVDRYEVSPFIVDIIEDNRTPQNYRYMADEEFEAYIRINKYDDITNNKVLNKSACYRIWNVTEEKYVTYIIPYPKPTEVGTEENPFRINKDGYFITPFTLQLGEYELREVEAPEGYIKQGYEGKIKNGVETKTPKTVVKFKVAMNTAYLQDEDIDALVITVNQYNDPMLGELQIEKQGEFLVGTTTKEDGTIDFNYELKKIEGAEFNIYAKEEILTQDNQGTVLYEKDSLVGTVRTNTEGIGYLDNLPIGKYYIKETKAGEGFTLNKEIKEFEIKYQGGETPVQIVKVDYTNERQKIKLNNDGNLVIEKVAEKKVYKPGEQVKYKIKVSNTGTEIIKNITVQETKINGEFEDIQLDNVSKTDSNTVIIKELKPNEIIFLNYIVDLGELDEDQDKLKVNNLVKAKGTIEVPDPDNPGEVIPKEVETEDDEDIVVTDKKLVIVKEALKEQYEPGEVAQYLIHVVNNGTEDIEDITVEEKILNGKFVELESLNRNGIQVKYLQNEDEEDILTAVKINKIEPGEHIVLKFEYQIPKDEKLDATIVNNVKATGKIKKINPDDPDNPTYEEVEDEDDEEIIIKEDNINLGIIKKDAITGEGISGATIGLYAEEDIKSVDGTVLIPKGTLIEKSITNDNGRAIFKSDLPLGIYYIQEIDAPEGYELSDEKIVFDATYRGQDTEYILESHILTDRSTDVKIDKKDSEGNLLAGAELEILDEYGNVVESFTTNDEVYVFKKLSKGKIYTLREKNPTKGYTTADEIKFFISNDGKLYKRLLNSEGYIIDDIEIDYIEMIDEKTKIVVDVVDKETKKHIPGIEVEIKDKVTGETVYSFVTGEEPDIIEGLPVGEYVIETKDPQNRGYTTETVEITVEDTMEDQKYVVEQGFTKVKVSLKDEETKELLPGGTIEIVDEDGNVVAEIETKEVAEYLERLPVGKYKLHQTKVPAGYWGSEDIEIEIKDTEEEQAFEMLNRRKTFNMSVEKKLIKQIYNGTETNVEGKLSKFEIRPQNIGKAEFWTIYTITVRNTGELEGKATIKELVPDGFEMYQESNLAWKVEGNEATLTTDVIQPGKSVEYEVALRWKQSALNIGEKTNRIQLITTDNEAGFEDENPNDNTGMATILVALSTGLSVYTENAIIAILVSVIILTLFIIVRKIYLLNKV